MEKQPYIKTRILTTQVGRFEFSFLYCTQHTAVPAVRNSIRPDPVFQLIPVRSNVCEHPQVFFLFTLVNVLLLSAFDFGVWFTETFNTLWNCNGGRTLCIEIHISRYFVCVCVCVCILSPTAVCRTLGIKQFWRWFVWQVETSHLREVPSRRERL